MVQNADRGSLRPDRLEIKRLAVALALSVALHAFVWGGYETGKWLGLWQKLKLPTWAKAVLQPAIKVAKPPTPPRDSEPPLVFVEVNPSVATAEPPKDAPFYSDKNSQAANVRADKDTATPKMEGTQEHVAKAEESSQGRHR